MLKISPRFSFSFQRTSDVSAVVQNAIVVDGSGVVQKSSVIQLDELTQLVVELQLQSGWYKLLLGFD